MSVPVLELLRQALWLVLSLSAPPIIAASIVGLAIALVQAVTQVQEQTVQFLFKLATIGLTLLITGSLLGGTLYQFANRMFTDMLILVP